MLKKKFLKRPKVMKGPRLDLKDLAKKLKGSKDFHVSFRKTWFTTAMENLEKENK